MVKGFAPGKEPKEIEGNRRKSEEIEGTPPLHSASAGQSIVLSRTALGVLHSFSGFSPAGAPGRTPTGHLWDQQFGLLARTAAWIDRRTQPQHVVVHLCIYPALSTGRSSLISCIFIYFSPLALSPILLFRQPLLIIVAHCCTTF